MPQLPVIGITAGLAIDKQPRGQIERYRVSAGYAKAILKAGGLPVILPPQDGNNEQLLEMVDGLLFSGGADIDPAIYGDSSIHPATYDIDDLRDRFELSLVDQAIARDMPVLCICRGIQVLNVALGGTLHQHIPDHVSESLAHQQSESKIAPGDHAHDVAFTPGTLGASLFADTRVQVNSHHHQSLNTIASGLSLDAISDDGVVEAVSLPGKSFVFGVQWHPELMFDSYDEQIRPFVALVEAAQAKRLLPAANRSQSGTLSMD